MPFKLCLLIVLIGSSAGTVHASGGYEGDVLSEFMGWSKDGKYWGVIVHEYESEGLTVHKGSQRLKHDSCAPECDTLWKISGHEYAPAGGEKVQKLMPVSAAWRKAFADKYEITRKNTYWQEPNDSGARARFRLYRRGEKHRNWESTFNFADITDLGTVAFVGGYLHPNGQFALLKFRSTSTDIGSIDREVYHFTSFVFVDLKAAKL